MKKALLVIGVVGIAIGAAVFWWMQPRQSDSNTVLSNGVSLSSEWLTLTPASYFKTTGPWSGLFIEIPGKSSLGGNPPKMILDSGGELHIEGYLTSAAGSKLTLQEEGFVLGERTYMSFVNPSLDWKEMDYEFRALTLRSNIPFRTGKVIWVSDNPANYKDGAPSPHD